MSILLTASESASAGSMIPLILMYVVVFGVFFYFVLYRPQKKEQCFLLWRSEIAF